MPTLNRVLFSEPVQHGMEYASCLYKKLAQQTPPPVQVIETNGVVEANDEAMKQDPIVFYGVGHGNYDRFTVECTRLYIKVGGPRIDWFRGMFVHLLSCITAQQLGPELINQGTKAYIGYYHCFYYGCWEGDQPRPKPCDPPDQYRDFYSMLDSDVEGERATLLRRASISQAQEAIKARFNYHIQLYTTGPQKDWPNAGNALWCLNYNLKCLRALGDLSFVPCPSGAEPDFKIVLNPSSITIKQGQSGTVQVKVEKVLLR